MNRLQKDKLLQANELIFEGNEILLNGDVDRAEQIYQELSEIYKELPTLVKSTVFKFALELRKNIHNKKDRGLVKIDSDKKFKMYNGRIITDLFHLVYVLDTISDEELQWYINSDRNEFHDWINNQLGETELATMLNGMTNKREIKLVIMRYLVLGRLQGGDTY